MIELTASREAYDLFNANCRYNFRQRVRRLMYQAGDLIKLTVRDTCGRVCSKQPTPDANPVLEQTNDATKMMEDHHVSNPPLTQQEIEHAQQLFGVHPTPAHPAMTDADRIQQLEGEVARLKEIEALLTVHCPCGWAGIVDECDEIFVSTGYARQAGTLLCPQCQKEVHN